MTLLFTQATEAWAQQKPPMAAATSAGVSDATGEIAGTILDEKREPVISAVVQAFRGEQLLKSTVSDYDGKYSIRPLPIGVYRVEVRFIGYDTMVTTGVPVTQAGTRIVNKVLTPVIAASKKHISVVEYKIPSVTKKTFPRRWAGPN